MKKALQLNSLFFILSIISINILTYGTPQKTISNDLFNSNSILNVSLSTSSKLDTFNYCYIKAATTLTLNDGKVYTWYKDSAATSPLNGSIANSTGASINWTSTASQNTDFKVYYRPQL